ncbi:transcription factor of the MADS box [Malassezia nana]|uniref:Transcription factor of the MADS box n=1 Tax=Malassezia nana TaxID=180528 RepID=A0AAF0J3H2_9BASI|nr:transcription factor of the MADS box [Malassezia nana]
MNSFLNESTSHDHAPYAPMYSMPGGVPIGQPYETMVSQGAPWAFPMTSMQNGQGTMPPGGLMTMPPDFAAGFSSSSTSGVPNTESGAGTSVPGDAQTPGRMHARPGPSKDTNATPASAPVPPDSDAARACAKKRTPAKGEKDMKTGRRKIKIEYIDDDSRRHITFSKRKAGIMKKAYELATLTGTQVLLLVVSQTGLVYTFTTPKLEAVVKEPEGRNLIQECLNAPDTADAPLVQAGPSSAPLGKEEEGEDEDGEDGDDDEEGLDIGHADAGFSSQAMSGVSAAPFAPSMGAPFFHPGWAPLPAGKRMDGADGGLVSTPPAALKRRRTQPNLSIRHSVPELPPHFYAPGMVPMAPLDRPAVPMFFDSSNTPTTPAPDQNATSSHSPSNSAEASFASAHEGPRSS